MLRKLVIFLFLALLGSGGVWLWYNQLKGKLEKMVPAQSGALTKPVVPPGATPGREDAVSAGEPDYEVIVTRNIFQAVIENPDSLIEEVEEDLEETTLRLVLLGTVVGEKGDARAIIIDETQNKQDLYRIGDAVQNAKIENISRGKVTLNVNGKTEALTIRDRKGGGPGAPTVVSNRSTQSSSLRSASPRRVPVVRPRRRISFRDSRPAVQEDIAEPVEPITTDDEELEEVLEEMGEDGIPAVAEDAEDAEAVEGGETEGEEAEASQ